MADELPLGRPTDYPDNYAPELLYPIARAEAREPLGIEPPLPFSGVDIWNAWELTWLGESGQPAVAAAEIRVPADSPNIVESKSLKLYLNSFAMSRQADAATVEATIARDLSEAAGAAVEVRIIPADDGEPLRIRTLPGESLDALDVDCDTWSVEPAFLSADPDHHVEGTYHTHALRSLCPVTSQPDTGSVVVDYSGPAIEAAGLLRYIVSYRCHQDFHEACVERLFVDILARCRPERLVVHARYQRRGGIDINPCRTSDGSQPENLRLWRQ